MEFKECIKNRRSVRKFKPDQISKDVIKEIVELASFSPSWKHSQIVRYTYTDNLEIINEIADNGVLDFEFNTKTLKRTPAIMVISYITNRSGYERDGSFSTPKGDGFEMYDAGIASQTLSLAAYEKGIGAVIMGYFDEDKVKKLLDIDEKQKIAAIIAMGYPDEQPDAPKRKTVDDLLSIK